MGDFLMSIKQMNDTLKIHTIGTEYIEKIALLINNSYRKAGGWTNKVGLVEGLRINQQYIKQLLKEDKNYFFYLKKDNDIAGCVLIKNHDNYAEISTLAVKITLQNQKIGSQLLLFCEHFIKHKLKLDRIILQVVSARKALSAFYLRRGYIKTELVSNYPASAIIGTPKQKQLTVSTFEKHLINKKH